MTSTNFTLLPTKSGKMGDLLLTICPVVFLMQGITWLIELTILPTSKFLAFVYLAIPMILMMTLGYFLVFRTNHKIEVCDNIITETTWLRKTNTIHAYDIASVRRGLLQTITIFDAEGKTLLSVEPSMTNFVQFLRWLEQQNKI